MSDPWKNILLIKPSSLGDIVMALPALASLRRSFPKARITWMVRPEFAPLLENHPHVDEIIVFDRKRLGKAWRHPGALADVVSLIGRLRRSHFDVVLDLQGLFRTGILAWLSGSPKRFGPVWGREFAHHFYTDTVEPSLEWVHVIDYYAKILEAMGVEDRSVEFVLPVDPKAQGILSRHDLDSEKYAVLISGSAQVSKCWPAERFGELADKLATEHGLAVVAIGGKSETPMIRRIQDRATCQVTSLAGETSLPELVEVLRHARIVVSNDTGPGHIAAALGRPLVMMFSWSNPLRVGPYKRPECLVGRDLDSRGLDTRSTDPAHGIEHITLQEVYQRVLEQLDAGM